ncbi:MAG: polyprenyl synthetase family protein [Myxococcales bacterium]|nr:polyprenyl synthetase family protein [Myxococcales bacterium]
MTARWPEARRTSPPKKPRTVLDPPGLDGVERKMARLASPFEGHDRVGAMAIEQLGAGGKRLRARLALAAARTLRASWTDAIPWAAAVELLHNATLVHDDVQDGDRMRRGRPALWVRHGVPQALNAGNFMLMLPYMALSEVSADRRAALCSALAEHAIATVRGQVAELDLLPEERLDWASYVGAAAGKTGAMFSLPIVGSAILAGKTPEEAAELGAPFTELGVLFQIYDDVLDLYGDKGREAPGCDLYEGKVSALVVEHLERRAADRSWLLELLRAPREATSPASVTRAIESFRSSGAVAGAIAHMDFIARRVTGSPALVAEPGLLAIATELVERCQLPQAVELEGVA